MDKQKSNNIRYNYYSSLDTQTLNNLLKLDFQASKQDNLSLNDLQIILNIITQRTESEEPPSEFDVEKGWNSFKNDYLTFVEKNETLYDFSENTVPLSKQKTKFVFCRKNIVIVAILCLLLGLFSTTAIAQELFSQIANWSKEAFWFENTSNQNLQKINIDLKKAFDLSAPPSNLVPSELPDKFIQVSNEIYTIDTTKYLTIFYEDASSESYLNLSVTYLPGDATNIYEKDNSAVTVYQKDGIDYYILNNIDSVSAIWKNGPFECQISGNITKDELKQIIDSIPPE